MNPNFFEPKSNSFILRWKPKNMLALSGALVILSVLAIFFLDKNIAVFFASPEGARWDHSARVLTQIGLGEHYFAISLLGLLFLYAQYLLAKYKGRQLEKTWFLLKSFFLNLFLCLLTSGIMVLLLKFIFGRARPYHADVMSELNFLPFNFHWDYHSFPSGHTQVIFTVVGFLCVYMPKYTWLFIIIGYALGFTRVILDYHFVSDVIAGSLVGLLGVYLVYFIGGTRRKSLTHK